MKAGVMLMLPAFLGAVQYAFGTRKLILCLIVIIGFQILVALPFLGETTVSEYLMRSRFAGGGRNGIGQAVAEMDNVGAHFNHTIFWKFLDEEMYYSKWWNDGLKVAILVLNVYHFFVRKWCVPRCVGNLLSTFNS
jgi:hypothetical protein